MDSCWLKMGFLRREQGWIHTTRHSSLPHPPTTVRIHLAYSPFFLAEQTVFTNPCLQGAKAQGWVEALKEGSHSGTSRSHMHMRHNRSCVSLPLPGSRHIEGCHTLLLNHQGSHLPVEIAVPISAPDQITGPPLQWLRKKKAELLTLPPRHEGLMLLQVTKVFPLSGQEVHAPTPTG